MFFNSLKYSVFVKIGLPSVGINLSTISKVLKGLVLSCWHACILTYSTQPTLVSASQHTGRSTLRKLLCWTSWTGLHGCWWQAGHSSDQPRLVGGLQHRRPRGRTLASAVRVWCDSHTANVDPLLPRRPDQYVKLRQHQSLAVWLHVGVPQGLFSVPHCLQYTVAQWLMLLRATASSITSMLTPSYVLPCTPTTHPTDWTFSLNVPLTSGRVTCRTDSSSIQTNWKHWSSTPPISCMLPAQPSHQCLLPELIYQ